MVLSPKESLILKSGQNMKNKFVVSFDLSSREYRCGIVNDTKELFGYVSTPYPIKPEGQNSNVITAASELDPIQLAEGLILSLRNLTILPSLSNRKSLRRPSS